MPTRSLAPALAGAVLLAACADAPTRPADRSTTLPPAPALGVGAHGGGAPLSIAFQSSRDGNSEIYLMNADGSDQTRVTMHPAADYEPDLSPNGKQVVFTSTRSGNADVWLLDLHTGALANLTATDAAEGWPRWSPNGKQVAFHSNRDGDNELYVLDLRTGELTQVTSYPGVDMWPEWSPEGGRLAFRRDHDVWLIELRTGELRQLTTDPALDQMAAWSPNGRQLAFMSLREGYCAVFLMDADGGGQANLTPKAPADPASAWCSRAPSWSTNGRQILYMSRQPSTGGDFEVFVMAADGSDHTRLTYAPGEDGIPTAR